MVFNRKEETTRRDELIEKLLDSSVDNHTERIITLSIVKDLVLEAYGNEVKNIKEKRRIAALEAEKLKAERDRVIEENARINSKAFKNRLWCEISAIGIDRVEWKDLNMHLKIMTDKKEIVVEADSLFGSFLDALKSYDPKTVNETIFQKFNDKIFFPLCYYVEPLNETISFNVHFHWRP